LEAVHWENLTANGMRILIVKPADSGFPLDNEELPCGLHDSEMKELRI
jgi:hypothetical protein